MSVEINCPQCRKRYSVPDAKLGKPLKCKVCGQSFSGPGLSSGPSSPSAATVLTTLNRFEVKHKLGAGAFGTVYRAYDPHLDREVALKVPNPGVMTDAKRIERFLREAKAAANLRHPHIVPVFDAGKDGDNYYIASAFIDGQTLSHAIPEGGVEFPRAARVARELAEALAYAHEQGVVHRDVKPANMMLDTQDHVHLMDFGLAVRQEEESRLTNDGAVMGTAAYMSPEQARGQTADVRPATDQYAAGVVLYELLTGTVPFKGPTAVVVHNVIHVEPDPPRKHRADVPKDLETICLKAMSKLPKDRYTNCQALADDLRRWLEGEPISARRMSLGERLRRWVKKEPKLAASATVVTVTFAASFVLVSAFARRADLARRQAETNLIQAEQDAAASVAAERRAAAAAAREERATGDALGALGTATEERKKADALRVQVAAAQQKADALLAAAEDERKGAAPTQALRAFAQNHAVQCAYRSHQEGRADEAKDILQLVPVSHRGWEWWHVKRLCAAPKDARPVVELKSHGSSISSVSFSPDGTRAVTATSNGTVHIWNTLTGVVVLPLEGHTSAVRASAFSSDGTRVVTAGDDKTARVWEVKTGNLISALEGHTDAVRASAFSSDGTRVVTAGDDKTARVWSVKTGAQITLKGHTEPVISAVFNSDGTRVVTTARDGTARVWDARTGGQVAALGGLRGPIAAAAFSPDGTRVGALWIDGKTEVWDARTAGVGGGRDGLTDWVRAGVTEPDRALQIVVAAADPPGTLRVLDVKNGTWTATLKGHPEQVHGVASGADGARAATVGDKTARIWNPKTGSELLSFSFPVRTTVVAWNSACTRLAIGLDDGTTLLLEGGAAK